jgi:chitin disaccharide deacetylase
MNGRRYLIVNADDFGLSPGVNRGITEAHEHGIVTSASLMVGWSAAAEAAVYGHEHPELSLGLHVDLGEWVYRDETWVPLYEVVPVDDITTLADEVSHQLAVFRDLTGKDPTHIDSHQHVHLREPVRSILLAVASELGVPVRGLSREVRYCGHFYGQTAEGLPYLDGISVDNLIRILMELPTGFTELGCHPGEADDLGSTYGEERKEELKVLCNPTVRATIGAMGIELRPFGNAIVRSLDVAFAKDTHRHSD